MEKRISTNNFLKLLKEKERKIIYTDHALRRADMRKLISNCESKVKQFEKDLKENRPHLVIEQDSDDPEERKFKLYYRYSKGGFIAYVIVTNEVISLITLYPVSRSAQKRLYKYRRRG